MQEYIYGAGNIDDAEAMITNNQTFTLIKDNKGSIRKIVDENANTVQSVDYDAFGNIISQSGSLENSHLYT